MPLCGQVKHEKGCFRRRATLHSIPPQLKTRENEICLHCLPQKINLIPPISQSIRYNKIADIDPTPFSSRQFPPNCTLALGEKKKNSLSWFNSIEVGLFFVLVPACSFFLSFLRSFVCKCYSVLVRDAGDILWVQALDSRCMVRRRGKKIQSTS